MRVAILTGGWSVCNTRRMQQVTAPRSSCARGSIATLHVHQHFGGLPDVPLLPLNYPHSSMLRNVSQVAPAVDLQKLPDE